LCIRGANSCAASPKTLIHQSGFGLLEANPVQTNAASHTLPEAFGNQIQFSFICETEKSMLYYVNP